MRATTIHGPKDVRVETVDDAVIEQPHDVVVRVTHACICGSDLWPYRGFSERSPGQRIGHEFLGVVDDVGSAVTTLRPGDHVIAPFTWSDGQCRHCRSGLHTSCPHGGFWGSPGSDGGQGEAVRVPHADGTLVPVPADAVRAKAPALLALSDVMSTGHHAAVSAGVREGGTVAVVGDGAVGLCAVLAAHRLGAKRIIALGRHPDRTAIATRFGATDVVPERGDEAVARVRELTGGHLADAVIEAVGTEQSMRTAIDIADDGATVGWVGVPHGNPAGADLGQMFARNIGLRGGVAPARAYIPELLADVLADRIDPSPVFDLTIPLADTPSGYAAMDERRSIKALIEV